MKINIYNKKQRYTYFEKTTIFFFFKRRNKATLFMFLPYLNFYEVWDNKIQQLNDKFFFLSSIEAFLGEKK